MVDGVDDADVAEEEHHHAPQFGSDYEDEG